jgi:formylglycine-generating enzyme
MVWCSGGRLTMGSDKHGSEDGPLQDVEVRGFWMDETPVTNQDFSRFVRATGYLTLPERRDDPAAFWRCPEGLGSSLAGRLDHPVVFLAYEDALAYARWAGKELPTEAEWEFAAHGTPEGASFQLHTRAVRSGRPNAFGLYDIMGNVWEWTVDVYEPLIRMKQASSDRAPRKVLKGGPSVSIQFQALRYRPSARRAQSIDVAARDVGFRCVLRLPAVA